MGEFSAEERARIKQHARDYDARVLAELLVGLERSRSLDREFSRRAIARAQKAEAELADAVERERQRCVRAVQTSGGPGEEAHVAAILGHPEWRPSRIVILPARGVTVNLTYGKVYDVVRWDDSDDKPRRYPVVISDLGYEYRLTETKWEAAK